MTSPARTRTPIKRFVTLETSDAFYRLALLYADGPQIRVFAPDRWGKVTLALEATGVLDLGDHELRVETADGGEWHGRILASCGCGSALGKFDPAGWEDT